MRPFLAALFFLAACDKAACDVEVPEPMPDEQYCLDAWDEEATPETFPCSARTGVWETREGANQVCPCEGLPLFFSRAS
jgi:hypothetical protein